MARMRFGFLLAKGAAWGLKDTGDHREKGSDTAGRGSGEMSAKSQAWVRGRVAKHTATECPLHPRALQRVSFSL